MKAIFYPVKRNYHECARIQTGEFQGHTDFLFEIWLYLHGYVRVEQRYTNARNQARYSDVETPGIFFETE